MVDVLSLLAAAGGVGGFATIMGVAYWLGGNDAFTFYREFFVEYLASEGVIKGGARELLASEACRVVRLALATPLSREEWEKLKEYLDESERGELALEEADEFLELARKVVKEYGEYPGAWKLHTYATITRALTAKKYAEKGGGSPVPP